MSRKKFLHAVRDENDPGVVKFFPTPPKRYRGFKTVTTAFGLRVRISVTKWGILRPGSDGKYIGPTFELTDGQLRAMGLDDLAEHVMPKYGITYIDLCWF